jgi:hypothetical protein
MHRQTQTRTDRDKLTCSNNNSNKGLIVEVKRGVDREKEEE